MTRGGEFQDSRSEASLDPSVLSSEKRFVVDKMAALKAVSAVLIGTVILGVVISQSYSNPQQDSASYDSAQPLRAQRNGYEAGPPGVQPASEYEAKGSENFLDVPKREMTESFAQFEPSHEVLSGPGASSKSVPQKSPPPTSQNPSTPPKSASTSPDEDCTVSDTVILLDSTGSLRNSFEDEKKYAEKLVEDHYAKNKNGRLGLVVYSSNRRFKLYGLDDNTDLRSVIKSAPFLNGVTFTGHALQLAYNELQKSASNVNRNLVVITDGHSFDHLDGSLASLRSLNSKPVNIYGVSVGETFSRQELLQIAGSEKNLFIGSDSAPKLSSTLFHCEPKPKPTVKPSNGQNGKIENLESLKAGKGQGAGNGNENSQNGNKNGSNGSKNSSNGPKNGSNGTKNNSNAKNTNTSTTTNASSTGCVLDVLFLIDVSGSVKKSYDEGKRFTAELVDSLATKSTNLKLGLAKFGAHGTGKVVAHIQSRSASEFKSILSQVPNQGATTYIEGAVHEVLEEVKKNSSKDKAVVVIVTDGYIAKFTNEIHDLQAFGKVIATAPKAGIALYKSELKALASAGLAFEDPQSAKQALLNLAQKC
ncbi:unnamed protein product [Bursaphelenchus okinawaensis]|uniref:VWFA domain-containing protein n=1 Tax=Bursaphelenchus okinawaensis TaxID=465554 RepID=A0A811KRF1_9BILA|nr:unnamed protein product [Bursaphelenchus okinawaensis]CAG9108122.1 unnamed protein product [Bursaphelenchus okinawaensis]